ncbi:MAG: AI-2E family transporter [Bacillota bacterium]|nr:AI-2E family transporter [Bacillota bacterium]
MAGSLALLYLLRAVFLPFLLAGLIAYLTLPVVGLLEARAVPRSVAILLAYLGLFLVAGALVTWGLPPLLAELEAVGQLAPQKTRQLELTIQEFLRQYRRARLPEFVKTVMEEAEESLRLALLGFARRLADLMVAVLSRAFFFLLAPVLAFYLLRDREQLLEGFLALFPPPWRGEVRALCAEAHAVVSGFIGGQLLVGMTVGTLIAAGLALLQIPFALLLGVLAGLFDLIPYFGPLISALPAVLLALPAWPWKPIYVVLLFLAVHQAEGAWLAPRVLSHRVRLHPLTVIFALLVGEHLWGVAGMLLAVPAAAILRVVAGFLVTRLREPSGSGPAD